MGISNPITDTIAGLGVVASIVGGLPEVITVLASTLGVVWFAICIYESHTFQAWKTARAAAKRANTLAKLKAKEKIVIAQIQAIELVRAAKVEASEMVAGATAEAAQLVVKETTKAEANK